MTRELRSACMEMPKQKKEKNQPTAQLSKIYSSGDQESHSDETGWRIIYEGQLDIYKIKKN